MEQESANKQYISIIRFLEHIGASPSDWLEVSRLKKLANAEFNMAATGFIEVDTFAYSKEDVLKELDSTNWPQRLEMHQRVYNCKSLLNLLESNKANWSGLAKDFNEISGDPNFDEFFSPYFTVAFNNVSRICINRGLLVEHADLLQYRDFVLPQHQELAFKSLRLFLEEQIRVIKNVSKENYSVMRPKMEIWLKPGWHQLLNNLPDDFFVYNDDLVHLFINLCVALQTSNRKDCILISTELVGLQGINPDHKSIIDSNHDVFIGSNKNKSSSDSGSGLGSVIWWIIWIIFIIVRIANNDSCKSKSNSYENQYKYTPKTYNYDQTSPASDEGSNGVIAIPEDSKEESKKGSESKSDYGIENKKSSKKTKTYTEAQKQQRKLDSIINAIMERDAKARQ